MKLEYSSIPLKGADYKERIKEARVFCEKNEVEFGVQIHNTGTIEEVQRLFNENVPLSFHAPIGGKYYINLGTRNIKKSLESLEDTLRVMEKYGVSLAVFHGFFMVDKPIKNYVARTDSAFKDALSVALRKDLLLTNDQYDDNGSLLKISNYFFDKEEYHERLEILKENLKLLETRYPNFTLCIENDFPCYSFGSILPEYIAKFDHSVCLDTGHLFASCVLHKLNFLEEAKKLISTGLVKCTHFHSTLLKKDEEGAKIKDGHQNLYISSDMPLKDLLRIMLRYKVDDYIFEIVNGNIKDFETFIKWKNKIESEDFKNVI